MNKGAKFPHLGVPATPARGKRDEGRASVLQPKAQAAPPPRVPHAQAVRGPVAPPAYRPNPTPKVLQLKNARPPQTPPPSVRNVPAPRAVNPPPRPHVPSPPRPPTVQAKPFGNVRREVKPSPPPSPPAARLRVPSPPTPAARKSAVVQRIRWRKSDQDLIPLDPCNREPKGYVGFHEMREGDIWDDETGEVYRVTRLTKAELNDAADSFKRVENQKHRDGNHRWTVREMYETLAGFGYTLDLNIREVYAKVDALYKTQGINQKLELRRFIKDHAIPLRKSHRTQRKYNVVSRLENLPERLKQMAVWAIELGLTPSERFKRMQVFYKQSQLLSKQMGEVQGDQGMEPLEKQTLTDKLKQEIARLRARIDRRKKALKELEKFSISQPNLRAFLDDSERYLKTEDVQKYSLTDPFDLDEFLNLGSGYISKSKLQNNSAINVQ